MVGSSLLPLAFPLLLLLPSSVVDCADPTTPSVTPQQDLPWTAFDPKKCEVDTSVFCLLPSDTGNKLKLYTNDETYTPKETQILLRIYNDKKILVEIWSEGSSAMLNNKDNTIFGCKISDGKVEIEGKGGEDSILISGENTPDAFYCRFIFLKDEKIFPYPSMEESQEPIKLITDKTKPNGYQTTRGEVSKLTMTSCDFERVKNEATEIADGYIINEIPLDLLFAKSITCPANSVLVVEHGPKKATSEARRIFCENKEFKWEKMIKKNNEPSKPIKTKTFNAGCKIRVCDMCAPRKFACQEDGCELPVPEIIDSCTVYKCPRSYMTVNNEIKPQSDDIRCTQIEKEEPRAFGWTFNRTKVERVSCPQKLRCVDVSPLECANDQACKELDIGPYVVLCRDFKLMRVQGGGSSMNVTSLACQTDTGKYMMQLAGKTEEPLPDGAIINCTAVAKEEKGETKTDMKTGQLTVYVAVGSTILLIAIVLVIIVLFCLRRAQRRKEATKLPATMTTASKTTLRTTKTMSGESKTPARTVPIPPPTPIAAAPLQRADADIKPWDPHLTERTPNAPTPLNEQRTQDQPTDRRERSVTKSLPMAEPPTPKAETAQPEGEDSKSGVESTKTKMREDKTFKRVDEEPHLLVPLPPKRRRASSHHDRSTHPSGEESTKRTQKDSKTKTKTQRTQDMRTDEAAANEEAARIPARPPPKKADYMVVPDVDKDSFDSEETKKSPLAKGPLKAPAKTPVEQSPYLKLEDMMSEHQQKKKKKEKEEKRKTEKDGSVMLITQDSEESMKKTK